MKVNTKYEIIVGLEVHIQLSTNSKAYCSDANLYGQEPNSCISPISAGYPGTLPKVNKSVIKSAIKLGLALNCNITEYNLYARKNYFYPDLPKGYQITQDKTPICTGGNLDITIPKIGKKNIFRTRRSDEAGACCPLQGLDHLVRMQQCAGGPITDQRHHRSMAAALVRNHPAEIRSMHAYPREQQLAELEARYTAKLPPQQVLQLFDRYCGSQVRV